MKQMDVERAVRGIVWPETPPELRARVLAAARIADTPVTWADRVWYSRTWRVVAAAAVAGALAIASLPGSDETPPAQANASVSRAIDEIGEELDLPRDVMITLARRTVRADSQRAAAWRVNAAAMAESGDLR